MSLSKKKSRTIVVEDTTYKWTISPDSGYSIFVAEKNEFKGCKIEVYFEMFVDIKNLNSNNEFKIITPKDAASIIRQATVLGWNPEKKGKPLVFDLDNNKLIKR